MRGQVEPQVALHFLEPWVLLDLQGVVLLVLREPLGVSLLAFQVRHVQLAFEASFPLQEDLLELLASSLLLCLSLEV